MGARKLYVHKGTDLITAIVEGEYIISMGRDDIPNRRFYRRLTKDEEFYEGMYSMYIMAAIADRYASNTIPYDKSHPLHPDHVARVRLACDIGERYPNEFLRWQLTQTTIPRLTETIEHVQSHKAETGRNI